MKNWEIKFDDDVAIASVQEDSNPNIDVPSVPFPSSSES